MEFDKSRCYSALNADELKSDDKVIVANDLKNLKRKVFEGFNYYIMTITSILGEEYLNRVSIDNDRFPFAYLVERKENCTNCGEGKWDAQHQKILCDPVHCGDGNVVFRNHEIEVCEYWKPKTEQKAEKHTDYNHCEEAMISARLKKHYRPFRDTNELVKVWCDKGGKWQKRELTMPYIWVRYKMNQCGQMGILITKFEKNYVQIEGDMIAMHALMADYEFLDGSPCGVEVE